MSIEDEVGDEIWASGHYLFDSTTGWLSGHTSELRRKHIKEVVEIRVLPLFSSRSTPSLGSYHEALLGGETGNDRHTGTR